MIKLDFRIVGGGIFSVITSESGFYGVQSGSGSGYYPKHFSIPSQYHSNNAPYSITHFYRRCVSLTVDSVVKQYISISLTAMNKQQNEENENGLFCTSADNWQLFQLACLCGLTAVRCNPDASIFRRLLNAVTATTRQRDRSSAEGFQNVPYAANLT